METHNNMTEKTKNTLTTEDFERLLNVISPAPVLNEVGEPTYDEAGQLVVQKVTQEEFDAIRADIFPKDADVEAVVQIVSLFVNNLRNFTMDNLAGLNEIVAIQREIIRELAKEAGVEDIQALEKRVIADFEADAKEKEETAQKLAEALKAEQEAPAEEVTPKPTQGKAKVLPLHKKPRHTKRGRK